jgi:hypothetical protein
MKADADPNLMVYFGGQLNFDARRGHLSTYWNWLTPVYRSRMKHEQDQNPLVGVNADCVNANCVNAN